MGLDMYAYAGRPGQRNDFYETAEWNGDKFVNPSVDKPEELAYWRKHPNLHGWMEKLAEKKGMEYTTFNGVELELTWQDLDDLERAVRHGELPGTVGFFFGDNSDAEYFEDDIQFIERARQALRFTQHVFYNSSW